MKRMRIYESGTQVKRREKDQGRENKEKYTLKEIKRAKKS